MMRRSVSICRFVMVALALSLLPAQPAAAQNPDEASAEPVLPLASKQQMIQDRFQRFQDRVFRLQQQLDAAEPENAQRLARVLEKAGQLALADRLDEIVHLLNSTGTWTAAIDAQSNWMNDADQLLDILLERDSESNSKKDDIDRLESYRKSVADLLKREQSLKQQSGKANAAKSASKQVAQAIKRIDALLKQQKELSAATKQAQSGQAAGEQRKALGSSQKDIARKTDQLAEDLKKLEAGQPDEGDSESSSAKSSPESSSQGESQSAKSAMSKAANAAKQGAQAMGAAQKKIQKDQLDGAGNKQQDAEESLEQAKKALEEAAKILKLQEDLAKQAAKQREVAKDTKALADSMQANASAPKSSPPGQGEQGGEQQQGEQGQEEGQQPGQQGQGQSGQQQGQQKQGQSGQQQGGEQEQQPPSPGSENVERAEEQMQKAAEALDKKDATKGGGHQGQAIDQLQQAQQQLEEALNQLRQEEKEEILRDLEMRFREMLSKQKAINAETLVVDDIGSENLKRSDKLQIAELSDRQLSLSQDAAKCGHILDEEGSTIAFPRVVAQLATDMTVVSKRLASLRTGVLTQTIQEEIVDTLSQLLEAVKKMQQENEQQASGQQQGGDEDQPLLPTSAELKLLRSSQQRVNNRTEKIEWARIEQIETESEFEHALRVAAKRQADCATIAKEMRDRLDNP